MKIFIDNANIITMDGERVYSHGSVVVEHGFIQYVGEKISKPAGTDKVIDAKGGIVMPGLINAHTHSPMTLLRGCANDLALDTWLNDHIFPLEEKLYDEAVYYGTLLACAEMIASGTTTFADMYFMSESSAKAILEAGMNANLSRCVTGTHQNYKKRLAEGRQLFADYHGAGDGSLWVEHSAHAVYTCSREALGAVAHAAELDGCGVHVHLSETMKENRDCYSAYGKSPTEVMRDAGLFNVPANAAHCVYLSENDMNILEAHNVSIAHNPTSNLKLASGVANIKEIKEKNINVALGTDGAASNNALDMFSELKLAALLHKGMRLDPTLINAREALFMATLGGARALGRHHERGQLKTGYRADLLVLDADAPALQPMHDPISTVVYNGCGGHVVTTMINGRLVMENRVLLTLDLERIKAGVQRAAGRMGL
ncbi:MAG: amidohydrolase [Ruminococcaceae bacterium]|nr:amidohydrolase [Oscillospiraceae bacterium]